MYLHFMGKLIHQNQITQDLSTTMHSPKKQWEEFPRSLSSSFKGVLLKFSDFREKKFPYHFYERPVQVF